MRFIDKPIKKNDVPIIHCIGDSHVSVFTGIDRMPPIWSPHERSDDKTNYFRTYRIGPTTAYQLNRKIPIIEHVIKHAPVDKDNDRIVFCFGEVDIRAHLVKQSIEHNRVIDDVVIECVDRYFKTVMYFKEKGYDVMIWGPVASWSDEEPYTGGPSYGSNLERNTATRIFNTYLENLCKDNDIKFLTIFDKMLLDDGKTNPKYLDKWLDCHIHLIQTSYPLIMDEFRRKKIIK